LSTISVASLPVREPEIARAAPVSGYRPELDAVRFLAFFLVFCHHVFWNVLRGSAILTESVVRFGPISKAVLLTIQPACGFGLCLFFCLSAYLITGILLGESARSGSISIRRFYVRRILRIWPLYAFGLLLGILWAWFNHLPEWRQLAAYVFFAGNIYCAAFGWSVNPMTLLWSISVEEQFYLTWPWAMRFLTRRGLWNVSILFIVIANISLMRLGSQHASTDYAVWTNTFVQFEMFATGTILALRTRSSAVRSRGRGVLLILVGPFLWFAACFFARPPWWEPAFNGPALMIGYGLAALGCAAVLRGFCILGPAWLPRWWVGLGKISYGLYVYHLLIFTLLMDALGQFHSLIAWFFLSAAVLMLTIVAAKVSYVFLESPFLRLKRRFEILHTRPV
jgi:peptidoglycan/LPS O-acetylase OafA/YrhL